MDVPVELSRIIINETSEQQVIVLKEKQGSRSFPIVIGIVEVFAIDRRLKGIKPPRPMTHDLLDNVIRQLDATIEKLVITELRNHTFYARITINANGKKVEIDSRPSDAIALSVTAKTPIFVAETVFEKTGQ